MKGYVHLGPTAIGLIALASTDEERGRIVRLVLAYLRNGGEGELPDVPDLKAELDRQVERTRKYREIGSKGGRPKTEPKPNQNLNETYLKPKNNLNETYSASRAQEETSSLISQSQPFPERNTYLSDMLKKDPPLPASCAPATREPAPVREDAEPSEPSTHDAGPEPFALVASPATPPPPTRSRRFVKPTVEQVRAYCEERGNGIDAQSFIDFYESKGWVVGKSPMKDWKAAVRTWERMDRDGTAPAARASPRPSAPIAGSAAISSYHEEGYIEKAAKLYGIK